MRNYRKLLAVILATTLVLSLGLTALASTTNVINNGEVSGSAGIFDRDFNDKAFICVLPTGKLFDFTLDPKGLLAVTPGEYYDPDNASPFVEFAHGEGGKIPTVVSESNVPVALDVRFKAVDTNTNKTNAVNWITTGAFDVAKTAGVYTNDLQIRFYAAKDGIKTFGTFATFATTRSASDFDTTGAFSRHLNSKGEAQMSFVLPAVSWKYMAATTDGVFYFEKEQTSTATQEAGSGTQIYPLGIVGSKGTWSDYAGTTPRAKLSVTAKFTVAEFTGDVTALTTTASEFAYTQTGLGGPAEFTWGASVREFSLKLTDDAGFTIGAVPANMTIRIYNSGTYKYVPATSNFANPGGSMTAVVAGKEVNYALPTLWGTQGWNKIEFTGTAVSNKTITLTKAGPDTGQGLVTVTVE